MSDNGAEEDGVDNRVQAPSWAPGEGSEGGASGQGPAEAASQAADHLTADTTRAGSANGSPSSGPAGAEAPPAAVKRDNPVGAPVVKGSGGVSARPTPPLPADAVGNGGVGPGIAARLSSSFAGLTRSKPKSYTPATRPAAPKGARPAPRPGAPRPGAPRPGTSAGRSQGPVKQTRRAQLSLERIEPWSVMKFSFLISLVGWVVLFIVVAIIFFTLSKLGVFTKIEQTWGLVTTSKTHPASSASRWFSASRVLGYTMLVGAVNVVVMTALATVGAVIYNLLSTFSGGIEVTLKESD
ncbi:MAG TPA: DUF3566 domain-containing protein [Streptosporangiaceae bacterium]